ncbi:AsnC family protein [Natronoarchaeum philippinense]|uniref:AsnC family protein n=1 Tax=Natronoarchaeum philippinense TaxID=558529 RepID=A0A285P2V3_NATPI|nr:Lrp/AsnC ligand binding domain-containing protein [Natronoarchaeum philippinense]SNZ16074.1 AsnC family protein [Natronoarchaeum philippinense]
MVRAYTVIDTGAGTSTAVCESIRALDGVAEAHVVGGEFDIVAELEGDHTHDLQRTLTAGIRTIEDVGTTRTYVCLE